MAIIGYARVSSTGQSLELQREQLVAAGCEKVFEEKRSGGSQDGREQLALALDYVRDGDTKNRLSSDSRWSLRPNSSKRGKRA